MKCDAYRDDLLEAAAVPGELKEQVRGHVEECPQCRAILQREQRLFAAVDEALRRAHGGRAAGWFSGGCPCAHLTRAGAKSVDESLVGAGGSLGDSGSSGTGHSPGKPAEATGGGC